MIDKLADLSDATIKSLIAVLAGMIIVWQRTDSAAIKVRLLTLAASGGLGFGLGPEVSELLGIPLGLGYVGVTVLLPGLLDVLSGLIKDPEKLVKLYRAWRGK